MPTASRRSRYPRSDAVRLLLIMNEVGEQVGPADPPGTVAAIRSQIALLARDFWVRYPDYLAEEILDLAVQRNDEALLDAAEDLLDDPDIDFDWLPMVRWRNGAYWWMTDAVAILVANRLIEYVPRPSTTGIAGHRYFLTADGRAFVDETLSGVPEFDAIRRRARLAGLVDPDAPGTQLKRRQYGIEEYASTAMGATIPPITAQVRQHAKQIREEWS